MSVAAVIVVLDHKSMIDAESNRAVKFVYTVIVM